MKIIRLTTIVSIIVFLALILSASPLSAQSVEPQLTKKLNDFMQDQQAALAGVANMHILIERVSDGAPVFEYKADDFVNMASVQKLFTSYAALKTLGADHKFPTEVYSSTSGSFGKTDFSYGLAQGERPDEKEDRTVIFVRPYGNPLMQFNDLLDIGRQLKAQGFNKIDSIVLDKTLFVDPKEAFGSECYRAAQTAAALEFNCYKLDVFPSTSGNPALIQVSPGFFGDLLNKTKSLSIAGSNIDFNQSPSNDIYKGKGFPPIGVWKPTKFRLHVEGKIGIKDASLTSYFAHPEPDSFYLTSLQKAFVEAGLVLGNEFSFGVVPQDASLVYEHFSEPLGIILHKLNHYSNNFIAGQIAFAMGQDRSGLFKYSQGLEKIRNLLAEIPAYPKGGWLDDASGLSISNKISARQVLAVLKVVHSDLGIYPVFMSSLPRLGKSGTLAHRNILNDKTGFQAQTSMYLDQVKRANAVWAKAGTIEGDSQKISSIAGYLEVASQQRLGFSITILGNISKNDASKIEDDIIKIMLGIEREKN